MTPEQLALTLIMTCSFGFLVVGWAVEYSTRKIIGQPVKQEARHPKNPTTTDHISFDCPGCRCESSKLRYDQTTLVQTPSGYALVAVCRTPRVQEDGVVRPCGCALISALMDASTAAQFVDQGAVGEYSRLVVFRAELGSPDPVEQMNKTPRRVL